MLAPLRASGQGETTHLVKEDEVRAAASVLVDPTAGVQIQALPIANWRTCRGDDLDAIAAAARELAPGNRGVYWTICPCAPNLAAPMASKYALRRRWLLFDMDPRREKDANSTDAEHEAAREVAYAILEDLGDAGWPLPVIIDSGNGWHLLFRIDLPSEADTHLLLREVIRRVAERFDNAAVEIDRKVHDARRISKLPGTLTRKGPGTPERPHRWARLIRVPDPLEVVSREQLQALAQMTETPTPGSPPVAVPFGVLKAEGKEGKDRKRAYALSVLEREEAKVVLAPVGKRNNTLYVAAAAMGNMVGAGVILRQLAESKLHYAATRNGLGDDEARKTIKSGLDKGESEPRDLRFMDEPVNGQAENAKSSEKEPPEQSRKSLKIYQMSEIMKMTFAPPKWAVPGILSEGLSILAGKPKLGKSFLALNLALTITAGGKALGDIETVIGDVLYLSLEDRLRRVQDRAKKVLAGLKLEASSRLFIAVEWPRQDRGGSAAIAKWLKEVDNPRLVIIDVWAKFRVSSTGRRNAYDEDYEAMSQIKQVLDDAKCNGLMLHHAKKGKSEDVMEEISGTHGIGGSADGTIVLTRSRCDNEAILHISGRDVEENQIALLFEPTTCCWTSLGDARLVTASKVKKKIIEAFQKAPRAVYWPSEIAEMLEMDRDTVKRTCYRMADEGLLKRAGGGRYSWPVDEFGPFTEVN